MEIKLAFYKNSKGFFGKAIRLKQKLMGLGEYAKYSHVEIVFPFVGDDKILNKINNIENIYSYNGFKNFDFYKDFDFAKYGLWFSSSEVDGGTRFKFIKDDKNHWDYHKIEVNRKQYIELLNFCIKQNGKKYDFLAIFFMHILKTLWFYKKDSWFCSEIITATLQRMHMLCTYDAITITPGMLAKKIYNDVTISVN